MPAALITVQLQTFEVENFCDFRDSKWKHENFFMNIQSCKARRITPSNIKLASQNIPDFMKVLSRNIYFGTESKKS